MTPYPDGTLKQALETVIWDKRDYKHISRLLNSKRIWTIFPQDKEGVYVLNGSPDTARYSIKPTVSVAWAAITGYIICEVPYHSNDVSNLELIIEE